MHLYDRIVSFCGTTNLFIAPNASSAYALNSVNFDVKNGVHVLQQLGAAALAF